MSEYISALVIQEMKSKEEVTGLIYSVLCYYDNNFLSFKEVFLSLQALKTWKFSDCPEIIFYM